VRDELKIKIEEFLRSVTLDPIASFKF
jgi:hypothetical protein